MKSQLKNEIDKNRNFILDCVFSDAVTTKPLLSGTTGGRTTRGGTKEERRK